MSVGKESLKRAANAAEAKPETVKTTEVKEAETVVAAEAAPEKKAPAKKAPVKRATRAKSAAKKPAAKKTVKTAVLTPGNAEELEKAVVSGEKPVHITEELPVYLL